MEIRENWINLLYKAATGAVQSAEEVGEHRALPIYQESHVDWRLPVFIRSGFWPQFSLSGFGIHAFVRFTECVGVKAHRRA